MIYPKFPSAKDTIGICAPSAGVGSKIETFNLSMESLRSAGFELTETASVRSEDYPSAPAAVRGNEFNRLFEDDSVSMVLCASGGDYCIEMLPYINQNLIIENPKWFCGYSDPTSIEMLLTTKLDIACIYGANGGAWDWRPMHEFQDVSLAILKGEIPVQHSYDFYSSKGFDDETMTYELDAPVKWELYRPNGSGLDYAQDLDVRGRLIGGCIDVIDWVIGTDFEDIRGFSERYADDGLIWFFDNFEMNPLQLQYTMRKMQMNGYFDNARAVVFGRTFLPGESTDADYLSQLERVFGSLSTPLVWNADIGHTKPSFTIINGAVGHLSYHDGKAELSMTLE